MCDTPPTVGIMELLLLLPFTFQSLLDITVKTEEFKTQSGISGPLVSNSQERKPPESRHCGWAVPPQPNDSWAHTTNTKVYLKSWPSMLPLSSKLQDLTLFAKSLLFLHETAIARTMARYNTAGSAAVLKFTLPKYTFSTTNYNGTLLFFSPGTMWRLVMTGVFFLLRK